MKFVFFSVTKFSKFPASTSNFSFFNKVDSVPVRQNGSGGRNLRSGKGTKFEVFICQAWETKVGLWIMFSNTCIKVHILVRTSHFNLCQVSIPRHYLVWGVDYRKYQCGIRSPCKITLFLEGIWLKIKLCQNVVYCR